MSKNRTKNLHIQLNDEEYSILTKNFPKDFNSPSEFVREVCMAYANNRFVLKECTPPSSEHSYGSNNNPNFEIDYDSILLEIKNLKKQNQEIVSVVTNLSKILLDTFKEPLDEDDLSNNLTDWIITNPDIVSKFNDIDEFMDSPEMAKYKTVFLKTLLRLKNRGMLKTLPNGALIWNI